MSSVIFRGVQFYVSLTLGDTSTQNNTSQTYKHTDRQTSHIYLSSKEKRVH